jgi:hypothetical protein
VNRKQKTARGSSTQIMRYALGELPRTEEGHKHASPSFVATLISCHGKLEVGWRKTHVALQTNARSRTPYFCCSGTVAADGVHGRQEHRCCKQHAGTRASRACGFLHHHPHLALSGCEGRALFVSRAMLVRPGSVWSVDCVSEGV